MEKLLIGFIAELALFVILNRWILDKNDRYKSLILFLLLTFFNFSISLNHVQTITKIVNTFYVPSIFVGIVTLLLSLMNKKTFQFRKEYIIFFLFILHFIYTLIIYKQIDQAHFLYMAILLFSILFIVLIYQSIDIKNFGELLYYTNYLAIANGILATFQIITGKMLVLGSFNHTIVYSQGLIDVKRAVGIGVTNNAAGTLGAILFIVVLYNLIKRKDPLSFISLIMTIVFSIITITRIGYLAIAIETIIFVGFVKIRSIKVLIRKIWVISSVSVVTLIMLLLSWNKINYYLFQARGDTLTSRFTQYQRVFENIISHNFWLGIGEAQYKYYLVTHYSIRDIDIHSQYLNVLAEQGIFVFILFVFANFFIIVYILRHESSSLLKAFSLALFVGNIISSNFNPNQYYYINNILYYFFILGEYYRLQQQKKLVSQKRMHVS